MWLSFFTFWLNTGARPDDLKALQWKDLNLDAATVSIQQNGQRVKGVGRVVGQPKTVGSRRPITLGAEVVTLLKKHRAEQNETRLGLGPLWKDNGLVFPSEVGTIIEGKRLREVFARICERAGVPKIRPYDLRHSSASLLLAPASTPRSWLSGSATAT